MPSFSQRLASKRIQTVALTSVLLVTLLLFPWTYEDGFNADQIETSASDIAILVPSRPVDWSRFAYVQYVTNAAYLCNSVMIFESLHRLGTKADRLMMYSNIFVPNDGSEEGQLLAKARDEYKAKLVPIEIQRRDGNDATWAESYTKLLAFNQTNYNRVLCLDSDAVVLKPMDELFFLPPAPVAMPRAYWLDPKDHILSSQIVLIQPSAMEFQRVSDAISSAGPSDYDMEIVNNLYGENALILPHRRYDLLTRAFRENLRKSYLGNDVEHWDPDAVLKEASFLHFSDWPVPKPWVPNHQLMTQWQPECESEGVCRARSIWLGFYNDFARRRLEVCGISVG